MIVNLSHSYYDVVAGGTRCQCLGQDVTRMEWNTINGRQITQTEIQQFTALNILAQVQHPIIVDGPVKATFNLASLSACSVKCCDERGDYAYRYGEQQKLVC